MAAKAVGCTVNGPYAGPVFDENDAGEVWLEGWIKRVKHLNQEQLKQEQEADTMARKKKRGKKREKKERE